MTEHDTLDDLSHEERDLRETRIGFLTTALELWIAEDPARQRGMTLATGGMPDGVCRFVGGLMALGAIPIPPDILQRSFIVGVAQGASYTRIALVMGAAQSYVSETVRKAGGRDALIAAYKGEVPAPPAPPQHPAPTQQELAGLEPENEPQAPLELNPEGFLGYTPPARTIETSPDPVGPDGDEPDVSFMDDDDEPGQPIDHRPAPPLPPGVRNITPGVDHTEATQQTAPTGPAPPPSRPQVPGQDYKPGTFAAD